MLLLSLVLGAVLSLEMVPGQVVGAQPAQVGQPDEDTQDSAQPDGLMVTFATDADTLWTCAQLAPEQRGEAILRQDEGQRLLVTWPRFVAGEELARIATLSDPGRGSWPEGMYQLRLKVAAGAPDEARLLVGVRILGLHKTPLPLLRLSPWERLASSGVLEQELEAEIGDCVGVPCSREPCTPGGRLNLCARVQGESGCSPLDAGDATF